MQLVLLSKYNENNQVKVDEVGRACSMRYKRKAHRILVGKPEGKRPLGKPRRRWVDNIKIHLREIGWDGMDWIDVAQDRDQWRALVNTLVNLRVPYNAGKFLSSIGGSSRRAQLRELFGYFAVHIKSMCSTLQSRMAGASVCVNSHIYLHIQSAANCP
jgi:hypothetical protein